jgi:hypothetical protein
LIRLSALTFDDVNQLAIVGSSKARLHGAFRPQLFTWLRREFQPEQLYVRPHPYEVAPDLAPALEEVALRPSDPKWWRDLRLWPGARKSSVYELEECSLQHNLRKYWEREVKQVGRLEVAYRRDNSGVLSCMIEELPRVSRRGFIVGYCLHLTSDSPVGTSWSDGITTHIDGAINLYFDGREHQRLQSTLEGGKVVDANCRTHLFRVNDAPLVMLFPIAQQCFRSECLMEEWIKDQFGDDAANGLHHPGALS